ncbi:TPA: hypothetical protein DCW54_01040 [Candidatus Dependentiae bacterium]|nr:MAG: hypothetical protein A2017_06955 [Lentisphaerae bacterium GWF2_44_16]HAU30207.1 hypothetical protein [Candidatus Dependentiae bacterium]
MCTRYKNISALFLLFLSLSSSFSSAYAAEKHSPEHKAADVVEHARKETTISLRQLWLRTKLLIHWFDQLPMQHPLIGNTLTVALGVAAAGAVEASVLAIAAVLGYKRAKSSGKENIEKYKKNLRTKLLELLKHIPKGTDLYIKIEELLEIHGED